MNENSNLNLANRYGGLVRGEGGCNDLTTPPPNQTWRRYVETRKDKENTLTGGNRDYAISYARNFQFIDP